jgi:hypothetical protein
MNNLSLARIMYGTNEDFQSSRPVKKPGLSPIAIPMPENHLANLEPPTLQEFLRTVWQRFTRNG